MSINPFQPIVARRPENKTGIPQVKCMLHPDYSQQKERYIASMRGRIGYIISWEERSVPKYGKYDGEYWGQENKWFVKVMWLDTHTEVEFYGNEMIHMAAVRVKWYNVFFYHIQKLFFPKRFKDPQ